jgi:hypothetical protein
MNAAYIDTVRLLLAVVPEVFESPRLAMKGGTAINLFVQDLPRLSVDIDVVFVDHTLDREKTLAAIAGDLASAKARLEKRGFRADIATLGKGEEARMFVDDGRVRVKVEVNYEKNFVGMTREVVALETLVATQAELLESLPRALTPAHHEFLRSLARLEPAWDLLPFGHLQELPAVRWKLDNLRTLQRRSSDKLAAQFRELDERLSNL